MKRTICICDREPEYAARLMDRINEQTTSPFEMKAFSEPETLYAYLQEHTVQVLLINPVHYTPAIREMEIPHVFLLSDGSRIPSEWSLPQIYQYQRAEHILQMIASRVEPQFETGRMEGPQLIGVYSPLHRIGKTTFALALCQEINRSRKALYVNLEDISGFEGLLEREYESDITDLLYYARQNREKFAMHLAVIVRQIQGITMIPAAKVPMELKAIRLEEWLEFLTLLRECLQYDVIVLDLGDGLQGLLEILTKLDRIYMPVSSDPIGISKVQQYEEMLEIMDYYDVLEHTRKLSLPDGSVLRETGGLREALLWGPMAGYARELIREDTDAAGV